MAKLLLGLSVLFMAATAFFSLSTKNKVGDLRQQNDTLTASLDSKTKALTKSEAELKSVRDQIAAARAQTDTSGMDVAAANAESQKAKDQLDALQKESESQKAEIARLTDQVANGTGATSATGATAPSELEARVKEAETNAAELTQVNQALTARVKEVEDQGQALKQEKERREHQMMAKGLEGQVLAVNRGWNFVVLSIGDRQGVTMNAQMIVKRGDQMVAKVRISSVEPSTSIADVIPGSAAQGTAVQPGDRVIYTGS
ncbi:MAG: hypothetical protein M3O82_03610 [Verrucomicrobiota bacterium]|nr:hypothetical protein [Verrucomicrobiota bacterium]